MFKASSKLSAEHVRAFHDAFLKKKTTHFFVISIALLAVTIYITVQFFRILFVYKITILSILFLYLLFAIIGITKTLVTGFIDIKKAKNPEIPDENHIYMFDENGFCMLVRKEGFSSELNMGYREIKRILENEKYFFVLLENRMAVIGKNEFTEGSPEELRTFLHYKMGERFEVDIY